MAEPGTLERPHVAVALVRQLAIGERPSRELAKQHGVTVRAVNLFARRHQPRILEVRRALDDRFAGIVFADKVNRVAALSKQAEDIFDLLADPEKTIKAGVSYAEMARAGQSALRAIADELGQISARHHVEVGGKLDVSISGVSIEDLM